MSWKNDQVSEREAGKILEVARSVLRVDGDFVELGCYKGDTSLLLAEILWKYNRGETVEKAVENLEEKMGKNGEEVDGDDIGVRMAKKLWIYDSFEGLPEKSMEDESALGAEFKKGELAVTKREVKRRFLRAGLPVPVIKKGWFSELTEVDLPEKIAFAFLDGDLYESIRDSLELIENKIAVGGVVVVHDYDNPALPGVTKAVDEWAEKKRLKIRRFESVAVMVGT